MPPQEETPSPASYDRSQLLAAGNGELFGPDRPRLPLPPMLMFDRIAEIAPAGGAHGRGRIVAELDIRPDLWFFACHFRDDPVMPGCLGLDAMWQLVGFYLAWLGGKGRGRALGCGEVRFTGQVTPECQRVSYELDMKRVIRQRLWMGIADGVMKADGAAIYTARDLRVGLFAS